MQRSTHAYLTLVLLSVAISAYAGLAVAPQTRIVGGNTVKIPKATYLVSLRYKHNASIPFLHRCSGTIYSTRVVLTTANCVVGLQRQQIHIVAGSSYITHSDGYVYLVDAYVIHPNFNILFSNNDLALLHLATELTSSEPEYIAPIGVAKVLPAAGSAAIVAGWGATVEGGEYAEQLQQAELEVVADAECKQSYGEGRITPDMLCAGAESEAGYVDACRGDAGSALVVDGVAVGLVSWGSGCGRKGFPGVYTNLAIFSEWIDEEAAKF